MQPDRIRGRKAVELRRKRLKAEPLCRECLAKGRITASTVPDHIVPLALGGVEDGHVTGSNLQMLCTSCHDEKTRRDFNWKPRRKRIDVSGWPTSD